jgi:hypothetical protein
MQVFYYWQKFTQNLTRMLQIESLAHRKTHIQKVQIRRLVGSMRRRLAAVIRVNESYTHY